MSGPEPAGDGVRGEGLWRRVDAGLAWVDAVLGRWVPAEYNLLAHAGAAANVALLVAVGSGVAMFLWYSPSLQFAHASLAAIQGHTLGGWVRAMHRYSSDLAMLLLVWHAARTFFARKFSGARWLPWVSGVLMLALIWFIGWTGYWLVWDQPAQQVAVTSMRLLDALPVFGEPLGRLYVADRTVPSLLFFVIFFLHMLLPLAIAVGLAVHLARLSRARLLPQRALAWAVVAALALTAGLIPAPLDPRAAMAFKAPAFTVDAWYLSPLAFGLRFQSAGLWAALFGGLALGAAVPLVLGRRRPAAAYQAEVNPARCHACTQCVQDCPFDAIAMVVRTDEKNFPTQAFVDPARCVGCGVCAGSCDSGGVGLLWFDTRVEEARIEQAVGRALASGWIQGVALVAADLAGRVPPLPRYAEFRVPTASWVRSSLVERLAQLGARAVVIVRGASLESRARDGGQWVGERLAGRRGPRLRLDRCPAFEWRVFDFDPARPAELGKAAAQLLASGVPLAGAAQLLRAPALGLLLAVVAALVAVAPSHLRVANPAADESEFIFSFQTFGTLLPAGAEDAATEAAKPVHMRGRATAKPRRAVVVVRLEIDGVAAERAFAAKGVSHDGPAIGEWRRDWAAGDHRVAVEIQPGGAAPAVRWTGVLRAETRHLSVITFDASGFRLE